MASTESLPDELVSIILGLLAPTERFMAMQVRTEREEEGRWWQEVTKLCRCAGGGGA